MISAVASPSTEAVERFACFGGTCMVLVEGSGPAGTATRAAERVQRRLLEWHGQFSRFERASELSRLNDDDRETVPVTATMVRFVEAALWAAEMTGGLVDPTLVTEVERAGYTHDLGHRLPVTAQAVQIHPPARPAAPDPANRWRQITVDQGARTVTRPVGLRLDSGGIAKGLFGDILGALLSLHQSFVIEAAGDIRLGGAAGTERAIQVTSPFAAGEILHTFGRARGAVATSGTTKRRWLDQHGRLAHHLLDPATGTPAFTGVVQATALAGTGVEAEALAKASLLAGPKDAAGWLPHGGVVAYDDGSYDVVEPPDDRAHS